MADRIESELAQAELNRRHEQSWDCWCEPLPFYRSQVTGAIWTVHASSLGDEPPRWVLFDARWKCDGASVHG